MGLLEILGSGCEFKEGDDVEDLARCGRAVMLKE